MGGVGERPGNLPQKRHFQHLLHMGRDGHRITKNQIRLKMVNERENRLQIGELLKVNAHPEMVMWPRPKVVTAPGVHKFV